MANKNENLDVGSSSNQSPPPRQQQQDQEPGSAGNKRNALADVTNTPDLASGSKSRVKRRFDVKRLAIPRESLMYKHMREVEEDRKPSSRYMEEIQVDLAPYMRETLIDWLVEVADGFVLVSDTLYRTVACIDRFLSQTAIERTRLQLLGITCMFIASKHEDVCTPEPEYLCFLTDNTYNIQEVVSMEKDVLDSLNFQISFPTVRNFLRIFIAAVQQYTKTYTLNVEFLCGYLAELSLLDYGFLRFLPSVVAASAVFLARFTSLPEMHPWSRALQCCAGYKPCDLKACVLALHKLQLNGGTRSAKAVKAKYSRHQFHYVALVDPPTAIPAHYFKESDE